MILEKLKTNFEIVRLQDYELYKNTERVCFLRHDVDLEIDYALELAELEHEMGIRATFFFLHNRVYFDKPDFIEKCKRIETLGHEVGLHYDVLSDCIDNPSLTAKYVFEKALNRLRENGLTVHGCSGHGGAFVHKGLIGYWIFKEVMDYYKANPSDCPNKKWNSTWKEKRFGTIELFTLSLKDYGLYEAYVMLWVSPRKFYYMSDCSTPEYDNLIGQINKAVEKNQTFCMCLMHPCRYRIGNMKVSK
jgi:hypothetical protein